MNPFQDGMRGGKIVTDGAGRVAGNHNQSLPPLTPYSGGQGQQQQQYYSNPVPTNYPEQGGQPRQYQQQQQRPQNANSRSGDQASLDEFLQQFYTVPQADKNGQGQDTHMGSNGGQPNGGGQQQQQQDDFDLSALTADNFRTVANGMDFTHGIPDEVLQYFQPDENGQTPNMLKGMMAMMNHVARNSYSNALAGAGRLAGLGFQTYDGKVRKEFPELMRRNAATQAVNSMGLHDSLRPSIDAMVDKVLSNNPNASPELIQEMVQGFLGILRGGQQSGEHQSRDNGIAGLFDN